MLNTLTFMSFISFGTQIVGDKPLQLPVHLKSAGFKSIRVDVITHGSSFNHGHLNAKYSLKFNNLINACLEYYNMQNLYFFYMKRVIGINFDFRKTTRKNTCDTAFCDTVF